MPSPVSRAHPGYFVGGVVSYSDTGQGAMLGVPDELIASTGP